MLRVTKALELMLSDALLPVSLLSDTVGFAIVVSMVKASAVEVVLTLPAVSVWRTVMDLPPSPVIATVLCVPVVQLVPAFKLYSHLPPASRPDTFTTPDWLILSDALEPVSLLKAKVGVATRVSSVNANALEAVLKLPAVSVWRTVMDLLPSPVKATLLPLPAVQVLPAFKLYSQVAPLSKPVTLTVPEDVTFCPTLVSLASASAGVATVAS